MGELFQSALPLRGATRDLAALERDYGISIRAPLAGSDADARHRIHHLRISIRAPLAGSDRDLAALERDCGISIRAPLAGSDYSMAANAGETKVFQSALPLRGATKPPMNLAA